MSLSIDPLEGKNGRGETIRTSDLLHPKQSRYQAALRPDQGRAICLSIAICQRFQRRKSDFLLTSKTSFAVTALITQLIQAMRILAFILFCLPAFADPFLERFCADCHDDTLAKGGLDLFALDPTLAQPADVATWVRVYDRIAAKEMPPPGKKQPKEPARMAFANALGERLSAAHHARKGTVLRRLNRREYENTQIGRAHV